MIECNVDGQVQDFAYFAYSQIAEWEIWNDNGETGYRYTLYFREPVECFLMWRHLSSEGLSSAPFGRWILPEEACERLLADSAPLTSECAPLWRAARRKVATIHRKINYSQTTAEEVQYRWVILRDRIKGLARDLKSLANQTGFLFEMPDFLGVLEIANRNYAQITSEPSLAYILECLKPVHRDITIAIGELDCIISKHSDSAEFSADSYFADTDDTYPTTHPDLQRDFTRLSETFSAIIDSISKWLEKGGQYSISLSNIPPLDKASGDWIKMSDVCSAYEFSKNTLRVARSKGQKSADGDRGIQDNGFVWQRDPQKHQTIWYLVSTLRKNTKSM